MGAFYTVAQYVPDPVADERINFGVIVFGAGRIVSQFTNNWKRLRMFGLEPDVEYVREFVSYVEHAHASQFFDFDGRERINEEKIRRISKEWNGSIRLTTPKASLYDHDALLKNMSQLMLRNVETRSQSMARTKQLATSIVVDELQSAMSHTIGKPEAAHSLIHKRVEVSGGFDRHTCDIGIQNGHLMHGIWTVSFDLGDKRRTDLDVKRAAWAIDDIRRIDKKVDLSVFALAPRKDEESAVTRASEMFARLGARFVGEKDAKQWARDLAETAANQTGLPLTLR